MAVHELSKVALQALVQVPQELFMLIFEDLTGSMNPLFDPTQHGLLIDDLTGANR